MTTFALVFSVLVPLVVGLLANELFAVQPWLTRRIVWLAARIDADRPDESSDIYAEHMAGINSLPGHMLGLLAASGLLFKVALARRVHDGALAAWCAIQTRIGLVRAALARRRAALRSPTNPDTPTSRSTNPTCHSFDQYPELVCAALSGDRRAFGTVVVGDLVLDEDTREVCRGGEEITLTATEFELLRYLMRNPRRVLSKAQILNRVWNYHFSGQANIVELYISYLRKKIDMGRRPMIHTIRGAGYVLVPAMWNPASSDTTIGPSP